MRILYLDLDTLRPDHLGCYGYGRNTSPNIDAIARDGVRFDQYYCSDAPCLPSRAALMSGRFGIHTGVVGHGGTAGDMRLENANRRFKDRMYRESLPMIFRKVGMRTTSISPFAERHSAWWFNAGFNEMYNTGKSGMESAEDVTPTALDWITRNGERDNWFLHINYWDPHTPYRAPEAFGDPFQDDPLPAWLTSELLEEHRKMVGPHNAREVNMYNNSTDPNFPRHPGEIRDMADMRRMIDGYDCGIRYMDSHIGHLFNAFAELNVLDDLTIIISSDHGENLGELGIYGEHATADAITPHIPMIIRGPGMKSGYVDTGLHYNIDLAPTLAELLGQEVQSCWDGRSYAFALLNGVDCGRSELVLSQCAHVCQRSVRWEDWVYIRTYHDGYHFFPQEMLFNTVDDPHEQTNLAATRPDLCAEAARRLLNWHDDMMSTQQDAVDPLWTVMREGGPTHTRGMLTEYCSYLEKTERGWAVEELHRRHPKEA